MKKLDIYRIATACTAIASMAVALGAGHKFG